MNDLKACVVCGKTYPKTQQYFYTITRPDGSLYYRNKCKRCHILQVKGVCEADVFREDFCSRCGIRFGGKIKNAQRSKIETLCKDCFKII